MICSRCGEEHMQRADCVVICKRIIAELRAANKELTDRNHILVNRIDANAVNNRPVVNKHPLADGVNVQSRKDYMREYMRKRRMGAERD